MSGDAFVTVAIARDTVEAAIWVDALRDARIDARSFERGPGPAFGGASNVVLSTYPVLVPRSALGAARNVIAELGGARALAPFAVPEDDETKRVAAVRAMQIALGAVGVIVVFALLVRLMT